MTALKNQLVLAGGRDIRTDKRVSTLKVLNENSQSWSFPFPPMNTARDALTTAIAHDDRWLVVVGGYGDTVELADVEILDTFSRQWYRNAPLPLLCCHYSSAIVGNMLML